ncbi:helix-turn-helix transcriptional regulator [Actinocorallia longicatena]|uniref:HTH luxR-type domain-containing protein n=1 Tax=Actinocorallia longicatena TaxID=111803 RepID=A0ABP6PWQ6_9ACTN
MRLAERDRHLTALRRLCAEPGAMQLVVLTGPAGNGKSALLRGFADEARASGALVLTAVPEQGERDSPCGVLQQLLDGASGDPAVQERFDSLLGVLAAAFAGEAVPRPSELGPALGAVSRLLLSISEQRPVVIVIDDVPFADPASLLCVAHLTRRMSARSLMVLLADRDLSPGPQARQFARRCLHAKVTHLALPLLTPAGVAEIVARELAAPELATPFHAATGGSPLLLSALIEDHAAATGQDGRGAGRRAFADASLSCVRRCGRITLPVAHAIAVARRRFGPRLIGALLGLDPAEVGDAVDQLTAAGLLLDGGFRAGEIEAAVLRTMEPCAREKMHHDAALLLLRESDDASEVAAHLVRAGRAATAPWGARALEYSARQALEGNRYRQAAEYLGAASRIASAPDTSRAVALLARAEWQLDPALGFVHVGELTEAFWRGDLSARQSVDLVASLLWHGDRPGAEGIGAELDRREEGFGEHDRAALRLGRLSLASAYPGFVDPARTRAIVERGVSCVTEPQGAQAAQALARVLYGLPPDAVSADPECLLTRHRLDETVVHVLRCLLYSDRDDRVERLSQEVLAHDGGLEARTWRAMVLDVRAEAALCRGEFTLSLDAAKSALDALSPLSWGTAIAGPLGSLLLAATRLGLHDEADEAVRRSIPEEAFATRAGLHYLRARGHHFLATDRPGAAQADFGTCAELAAAWGVDRAALVPWRVDLAEAHLASRDHSGAARLASAQLAHEREVPPRVAGRALRILAEAGELEDRVSLLERSAGLLRRSGDHYGHSRTLASLAAAYRAAGDVRRAKKACDAAHRIAVRWAFPSPVTDGTAPEPPRIDRRERFDLLTDQERRVLTMAAEGQSNREIAGLLYVTVSTVEQHLTNCYRKLKIKSRVDIPLAL